MRELLLNPPDERTELLVFDMEAWFATELESIRKSKTILEADAVAVAILNALPGRADIPEGRRQYLQTWLSAVRSAALTASPL